MSASRSKDDGDFSFFDPETFTLLIWYRLFGQEQEESLQQRAHNVANIQRTNVSVRLPNADKNHGLAGGVYHSHGSAYFVVNRVELGQHNSVNLPRSLLVYVVRRMLDKRLIETPQLVHTIIPNQRFADK
jgi:hypothetical protein